MHQESLSTIKIPQGCQDWKGVDSVPWVLELLQAGLTKKAIADHFGKTVVGIDKAVARFHRLKQKPPTDIEGSTCTEAEASARSTKKCSTDSSSPTREGNAHKEAS